MEKQTVQLVKEVRVSGAFFQQTLPMLCSAP